MKLPLSILFTLIGLNTYSQLDTGAEVIIPNQVYVIHSELKLNGTLINTSNIFCLKGTGDTLWIFSMGYGDPADINIYRDTILTTSLQQDLRLIDSVSDLMGLVNPKPMCIAAHAHLDHVNQELWFGLDSLFGIMESFIYIHMADHGKATCNCHCCGVGSCAQGSTYFGVPYLTPWSTPTLARFRVLGTKNQPCGATLKTISTPTGNWKIRKSDNAHTNGSINLEHPVLNYRINGADVISTCFPPAGWTVFNIHGNL